MRLFRVEDGRGAVYWVLSETGEPADVQAAIEEIEGSFESNYLEPLTVDDVREVLEAEARATVCRWDGEPDTDMWTAALAAAAGRGRVVACSEW